MMVCMIYLCPYVLYVFMYVCLYVCRYVCIQELTYIHMRLVTTLLFITLSLIHSLPLSLLSSLTLLYSTLSLFSSPPLSSPLSLFSTLLSSPLLSHSFTPALSPLLPHSSLLLPSSQASSFSSLASLVLKYTYTYTHKMRMFDSLYCTSLHCTLSHSEMRQTYAQPRAVQCNAVNQSLTHSHTRTYSLLLSLTQASSLVLNRYSSFMHEINTQALAHTHAYAHKI